MSANGNGERWRLVLGNDGVPIAVSVNPAVAERFPGFPTIEVVEAGGGREVRVGALVLVVVRAEEVQPDDRIYEAGTLTAPVHVNFQSGHNIYEPEDAEGNPIHCATAGEILLVHRAAAASAVSEGDGSVPEPFIALRPGVRSGWPCVNGSRLDTETLARYAEHSGIEAAAEDYEVSTAAVKLAVDYEAGKFPAGSAGPIRAASAVSAGADGPQIIRAQVQEWRDRIADETEGAATIYRAAFDLVLAEFDKYAPASAVSAGEPEGEWGALERIKKWCEEQHEDLLNARDKHPLGSAQSGNFEDRARVIAAVIRTVEFEQREAKRSTSAALSRAADLVRETAPPVSVSAGDCQPKSSTPEEG